MAEAVGFDLRQRFTVPIHVPRRISWHLFFRRGVLEATQGNALHFAQICDSLYSKARDGSPAGVSCRRKPIRSLMPRHLEALISVGEGKSDEEIAELMRITRFTADQHVEGACNAYGSAQRAYLAARALLAGQIDFADLLRR